MKSQLLVTLRGQEVKLCQGHFSDNIKNDRYIDTSSEEEEDLVKKSV